MSEKIEFEGIYFVAGIVNNEFGWIWRDTNSRDHGIDGKIEVAEQCFRNTIPFSRELNVQIKSGDSYFTNRGYALIRITERWFNYWSDSNIPVIVVAYWPERKEAYWTLFPKGIRKSVQRSKYLEIPVSPETRFHGNAKSTLNLIALRYTPYGLSNSTFIDSLFNVMNDSTLIELKKSIIRTLFFRAEVNQLNMENTQTQSLFAIDTSIEDFDIFAWQKDHEYRLYLDKLLLLKRQYRDAFNYRQVFSISVPLLERNIWNALVYQINVLLSNNICVGVINRNKLSQDLNRDFSIINSVLVMKYNIGTWNCDPLPGRVPASLYNKIFLEISNIAYWCNPRLNWETGLARYLDFPFEIGPK